MVMKGKRKWVTKDSRMIVYKTPSLMSMVYLNNASILWDACTINNQKLTKLSLLNFNFRPLVIALLTTRVVLCLFLS